MREYSFQETVERSLSKKFKGPIYSKFLEALVDFKMISTGDKVAIALSGGKDSLLLAKLFQEFKRHGQVEFDMVFLTMDPGFSEANLNSHLENCQKLGIPVTIEKSNIFSVTEKMAAENPCFLCARMRRGFLYKVAKELGCNKLALGHHFDDVIETTLMNMFYAGCYKTMLPKVRSQNYEGIELIRPMYYVKEADIHRFVQYNGIETMKCGCKISDGVVDSKRQEVKRFITQLRKSDPNIDINIFRSAQNVNLKSVLGYHNDDKSTSFLDDY
jgi:tRNA(Ile)-lysidine synthase TilS/MesJ